MTKLHVLTKFDSDGASVWQNIVFERADALREERGGPLGDDDPGDGEGIVILVWPKVFVTHEDAAAFAQWTTDDFFQILRRDLPLTWTRGEGHVDGHVTVDTPDGAVPLSFRIREVEVACAADQEVHVVSLARMQDEREASLNQGVVYATLADARAAVLRELDVTDEEAHWDSFMETHVAARPGRPAPEKENMIIGSQVPWRYSDVVAESAE